MWRNGARPRCRTSPWRWQAKRLKRESGPAIVQLANLGVRQVAPHPETYLVHYAAERRIAASFKANHEIGRRAGLYRPSEISRLTACVVDV